MKNLNCTFIVLQRGSTTKTKDGNTVVQYLVADASGSIQASFWDEKAEALQPGDIFRVKGGYTTIFKTSMVLYCSRNGVLERLGEFTMVFTEEPKMSEVEWVADPKAASGWTAVQARAGAGARLAGHPR
jgi:ssDNA-binding replication factor A large subunit